MNSPESDKFHVLDSLIAEHNGPKYDVDLIRLLMGDV